MKKVLSWLLVISMMVTAMALPMAVYAEETTTEGTTEETTPTSKQVVHFNYDFEDYQTTGTLSFPNSKTAGVTGGSWDTLMSSAGNIVQGVDGNAFHFTKDASSGMYATYNPTANVASGKWLYSFDIAYNTSSANSRVTWLMNNSSPKYLYFMALQHPASTEVSSITAAQTRSNGNVINKGNLFKATDSEREYTVDILLDYDSNLATYYVNGVKKTSNAMTATETYTFAGTTFKLNLNNNINKLDNFMLIENPDAQYSFSQKGEVTTQSEYITVRFSDTVRLTDITDFIITDVNGETAATVIEIEQVNGKFYNLKLSNKLNSGTYNLTLADTTLTSVIAGTTSSNTTSEFTVKPEYTYFEMDFENYASLGASKYFAQYADYGTASIGGGSLDLISDNTYQFVGGDTKGLATKGSSSQSVKLYYTPKDAIQSGVLKISFDAAFDSTRKNSRNQLFYVNDDTTNGNLIFYGTTETGKVIAGVNADLTYRNANPNIAYEDNKAYRWDIVVDLDNKKLAQYCDGTEISSITYTRDILPIEKLTVYFGAAITFFDNYKMTVNVNEFGYTATDIPTDSNSTTINFDDTMVLGDTDLIFKDPEGNAVTPLSITKISPRKYKVAFAELFEGAYTVSLADGKKSAIGNVSNTESVTFNVAERPIPDLTASSIEFSDVEGGVKLNATISNTTENLRKAFLIIGIFKDRVLEECIADVFEISAGEENVEKTVILTTELDLSQYTVRGFVWDREDISPLIGSITR